MNTGHATIQFYSADIKLLKESAGLPVDLKKTEDGYAIDVCAGRSIQETIQWMSLRLPRAAVAIVNGQTNDLGYVLQPDDSVMIIFQISGG